jgi:hypothetical protein
MSSSVTVARAGVNPVPSLRKPCGLVTESAFATSYSQSKRPVKGSGLLLIGRAVARTDEIFCIAKLHTNTAIFEAESMSYFSRSPSTFMLKKTGQPAHPQTVPTFHFQLFTFYNFANLLTTFAVLAGLSIFLFLLLLLPQLPFLVLLPL